MVAMCSSGWQSCLWFSSYWGQVHRRYPAAIELMILLLAIAVGLLAGLARARIRGGHLQAPELRLVWWAPIAFLPQWLAFHFPTTRDLVTDRVAAAALVGSQLLLLVFAWVNRKQAGVWLLGAGLVLNLCVIIPNKGLMPVSPEVVAQLLPDQPAGAWQIGERIGWSIILPATATRLWWLSDHFLVPAWFPYRKALSVGDLFIAAGAFWFLWTLGAPQIQDDEGA
jgi:hypothetical protein